MKYVKPFKRDLRGDLLTGFGGALLGRELPVEHHRVDRARAQHVGPDLPILEFAGPRPGERPERCLGGAVGAAARKAFVLPSGRHEDDGSAIIQMGQRLLNGEISTAGVGVEGLVEMLGRRCGGHRLFDEGRSRKNHINLALLRDGLVETVEVIELGDVGLYAGDVRADLCDGFVELGLPPTGDEHIGALFNEPLGGREADAATAVTTAILFFNKDILFPSSLGLSLLGAWTIQTLSATVRATLRAGSPTLAPSRYAVSFTAEIMPCVSVDWPSPIHAESAATVAAAIPSESRIGRAAAPARSAPKPASLKKARRGLNKRVIPAASAPPWLPLATTKSASSGLPSEMESMQSTP